jgi:hypothetical protein
MRVLLIVGLFATALAVSTCGDDAPSCGFDNCPGCCQGNTCVEGFAPEACGVSGMACTRCLPGETCSNSGWCEGGGSCGPSTCGGCCSGSICQPGSAADACGAGGAACTVCPGGQICQAGTCRSEATCDPSTCASGCCSGTRCMAGNSASACGTGGGACTTCSGGDTCVAGSCGSPADPCDGVPMAGRCTSTTGIEVCVPATGGGTTEVRRYDCASGQTCQVVGGEAQCVLTAECLEGATQCAGSDLQTCVGGWWNSSACPTGCVPSAVGAFCPPAIEITMLTAYFQYEMRAPDFDAGSWSTDVGTVPAQSFLVISVNVAGGGWTPLDATYTGGDGSFTIAVPAWPTPDDVIFMFAAGLQADGNVSYVVADPNLAAGSHRTVDGVGAAPAVWSWWAPVADVPDGSTVTITEAIGAGAARVFDYMRYVYVTAVDRWFGAGPGPLVIWLGMDVSWDCGSCAGYKNYHRTSVWGVEFQTQIWLGGSTTDQGWWSDGVTTHELGHWAMDVFGQTPYEGGGHCAQIPTLPGQAWSEGWATWFSSDAREDPTYADMQDGGFFWWSIDTRLYSGGTPWPRPDPWGEPLQLLSENEVAAMLWALSATYGLGRGPMDAALASARMTVPPYARGYRRHEWDFDAPSCTRLPELGRETADPAPAFPDFLDALIAGGVDAFTVDFATEPYPYP